MSKTNEKILNSLAVLEQNLDEINSAKEQVNKVVESSGNLANVIQTYQKSFEDLSINVKSVLEDSRKFNFDSIAKLSEQTKNINKEIEQLTDFDVTKYLKSIEDKTIKQFQQNLGRPIGDLDKQIKNIEYEVAKLTEYDFKDSFDNLEKQVVNQFKKDLKGKLNDIDGKVLDLQSKIDEFKVQISRLQTFDFESHFKHHQKILRGYFDKQREELVKNHEEVTSKSENLFLRLDQQDKEIKALKTLLFVIIGIIIIAIVTTIVMN